MVDLLLVDLIKGVCLSFEVCVVAKSFAASIGITTNLLT